MNNWHTIWNNRHFELQGENILTELLKTDGMDILGHVAESAWSDYVTHIQTKLAMTAHDSIFEVGCGAGALLYLLYQQGRRVGGVDYAEKLITIAKQVMPEGHFSVAAADDLTSDEQYDFVISSGVFLYFSDYDYASIVLQRMLAKAKKGIAILDVPDRDTQTQALIARKQNMGDELYEQRYKSLDHLYFSRSWFQEGLKNESISIHIEQQVIENYLHSPFRFNVFIKKYP